MHTGRKTLPSIYVQAAIALMLIQLFHKIVREIPGAFNMGARERSEFQFSHVYLLSE
jgi:hypothetical protein